ncbi:MAG: DUF2730 family protein [Candidatus Sphingomonas phytovorans]|nr:DUF2730 family protein [Sphingomonas sp.]WEK00610.1 MAG: DUF2730 family protein [Sphingomonas sp.]
MTGNVMIMVLTAASLALGIANTIWAWLSRGSAKTADHERRLMTIEGDLKHLPNKEDVTALRLGLSEMNGKLNTAESELSAVARTVRRIEDHLVAGAK